MENKEEQGKMNKPAYDGRLLFYPHLIRHLEYIGDAQINNDYKEWYRGLRGFFYLTKPFIEKEKAKDFSERLDKVRISGYSHMPFNLGELFFIRLTEDMIEASKHLLLPIQTDEETEFLDESFKLGSDT